MSYPSLHFITIKRFAEVPVAIRCERFEEDA